MRRVPCRGANGAGAGAGNLSKSSLNRASSLSLKDFSSPSILSMALVSLVSNSSSRASTSSARPTNSSEKWACSSWFVIVAGLHEVSVMVSPLKSTGIYAYNYGNMVEGTRNPSSNIRSSYKFLPNSRKRRREEQWVQRLNRAITRSRDTARGEICGALGRLSKGVSNYQNSKANVERMLNDGTVLVLV